MLNVSVSRKSAPVIQPGGPDRIAGGLPTPRPPGCVMSTVRECARVIDEVYGPGFHYRTPLSPLGAYLARITPGSVSGYLPPNVASFVCSLSRVSTPKWKKATPPPASHSTCASPKFIPVASAGPRRPSCHTTLHLTKGLRQKAEGPCRDQRLSESRFAGRCEKEQYARHLGTHGAARVCRLIYAKGPRLDERSSLGRRSVPSVAICTR
jgi:hypothetical protein